MTEISKEYAEALFSLACETGEEVATRSALETVAKTFEEIPSFMEFLHSPAIPLRERLTMIEQNLAPHLPERVVSWLCLLCEKGRIASFPECVKEYNRLLDAKESIFTATVTSAVALTPSERTALKQKLENMSGHAVTLDCSVDPTLLGGMVVEMNGTVMDGSLRHRLRKVKEVMNR